METPLTPRSLNAMDTSSDGDNNPRPLKRLRTTKSKECLTAREIQPEYAPIPGPQLMLSLPSLLSHPPTHKNHKRALDLSRISLKACLEKAASLDKATECRAWTELAEVGFKIGLDVEGVESDVEKGITKALLIAKKHPSLRHTIPSLTLLSARLSIHRGSSKVAQTTLKKLITHFLLPSDEPALVYRVWLAYISSLCGVSDSEGGSSSTSSGTNAMTNAKALTALRDFRAIAEENGHDEVVSLALVMEVKECMDQGMWMRVGELLVSAEAALGLSFDDSTSKPSPAPLSKNARLPPKLSTTPTHQFLTTLTLLYGTLFHTYAGSNANSQPRMKRLHEILDAGALDAFGVDGVVRIPIPPVGGTSDFNTKTEDAKPVSVGSKRPRECGPKSEERGTSPNSSFIELQTPHPRHIFTLSFLISSLSKRDPVGRKPKRRVFAQEGVLAVEREVRKEVLFPKWATERDVQEWKRRMERVRADMLCELVGVAVQRSEFDDAQKHLGSLTTHTLTHGLFPLYSARITLHHAHLAHAHGGKEGSPSAERAMKCYDIAAWLSRGREEREIERKKREEAKRKNTKQKKRGKGTKQTEEHKDDEEEQDAEVDEDDGYPDLWVHTAAKAGLLWLKIGLAASTLPADSSSVASSTSSPTKPRHTPNEPEALEAFVPSTSEAYELYESRMDAFRKDPSTKQVIKSCRELGGTLSAIGDVLEACLAKEYLSVKSHLRTALNQSTSSVDNHLRALVLCLIAGQYMHTAGDHAGVMLNTADGLVKGLGAVEKDKDKATPKKDTSVGDGVGNAHTRLWIGERCLELKRRVGDEEGAVKQVALNKKFEEAVERVEKRGEVKVLNPESTNSTS